MGRIKQMSDKLANQIAAGEVVERPASVVKELVENAIDANATEIQVDLIEAGIQRIRVKDNGDGMSREDVMVSYLPHATSKIYTIHDLFHIHSLGFRGEALASIGSVSKLTIESTQADAPSGYAIQVEGSQLVTDYEVKPIKGTVVTVDSLFFNTPARLKHLRTIQTELRHSLKFIQNMALAYPNIRFTLTHDHQQLFFTAGNGNLMQTIANVYSASIARQLIFFETENIDFKVSGFISPPTLTRTNKNYLHWSINQRPIQSFVLDKSLIKSYGRRLMIGRYPLAVVNIELDPQLVDVNVHPTKQTVRLSKEEELIELINQEIETVLQGINPIPQIEVQNLAKSPPNHVTESPIQLSLDDIPVKIKKVERSDALLQSTDRSALDNYTSVDLKDQIQETPTTFTTATTISNEKKDNHISVNDRRGGQDSGRNAVIFRDLRYIGQIHGTYLVAETEASFYLIDQHAAHERIRYEHAIAKSHETTSQQQLLMPIVFDFSIAEMIKLEEKIDHLHPLGIYLTQLGPTSYQLVEYPNWIEEDKVELIVRELVELILEGKKLTVEDYLEKAIIMHSCRGAIKANHYLDDEQAKRLIADMAQLKDPFHCPHGRPIFIEFTEKNIEKMFKRIPDAHEPNSLRIGEI